MTILLLRCRSEAHDGEGRRHGSGMCRYTADGNAVAQRLEQGGHLIEHEALPGEPGPGRRHQRAALSCALRRPPCGSRSLGGLAADLDPVDAQQAIEEGHRAGRRGLGCALPAPPGVDEGSWIAHRVVRAGVRGVLGGDGAGPTSGHGQEPRALGHVARAVASTGPDLEKR